MSLYTEELFNFIKAQPEFEKMLARFNNRYIQDNLPLDVFTGKRRNISESENIISIDINGVMQLDKHDNHLLFIVNKRKCLIFIESKDRFDKIEFGTARILRQQSFPAIFLDSEGIKEPSIALFEKLKSL